MIPSMDTNNKPCRGGDGACPNPRRVFGSGKSIPLCHEHERERLREINRRKVEDPERPGHFVLQSTLYARRHQRRVADAARRWQALMAAAQEPEA